MNINIEIEGLTPLIMNKFTDAAQIAASEGSRGSSAAEDRGTPLEIAESKIYVGLNGKPMIPQPNLMSCFGNGGRFHKIGANKVTTQKASMIYSFLDVEGVEIELIHKQPWKVDTRPVRIPKTGGRILAHRPMWDDWRLAFTVDLDTSICNKDLFRRIVDDVGKRCGLGDFRPACSGPFGKFVVIRWEVETIKPLKVKKAA